MLCIGVDLLPEELAEVLDDPTADDNDGETVEVSTTKNDIDNGVSSCRCRS